MELLDSSVTTEISRDVSVVFAHWPVTELFDNNLLLQSQRISRWRPLRNVALITNKTDLRILAAKMPERYPRNTDISSFRVLFQYDNILRLAAQ